jgi:hypothetical protein
MQASRRLAVVSALACALACSFFSPPGPHHPVSFTQVPDPHGAERFPNWSVPPAVSQKDLMMGERLAHGAKLVRAKGAGAGTTGAEQHVFYVPELGREVALKAKPVPAGLDGINNSPRKELAAYRIQHLFLDPEDYVVPTTFAFCIPMKTWREEHGGKGEPNVAGLDCELSVLALWLQDVTVPDRVYDEDRFLTDPSYAYYLSNFNVFTYVIDHRDGRRGNFLVSKDDAHRHVFAIDNGSTFNPLGYNYFVPNWNVIRVAAVRRETIDRLRRLSRADLDFLLVVAQLHVDEHGIAHQVHSGPSLDDDEGALRRGDTIQFGLTRHEIDGVWQRIQRLIRDVDEGRLPVF